MVCDITSIYRLAAGTKKLIRVDWSRNCNLGPTYFDLPAIIFHSNSKHTNSKQKVNKKTKTEQKTKTVSGSLQDFMQRVYTHLRKKAKTKLHVVGSSHATLKILF